jgi:tRNA1(Val) A37 N6-methylase TrmN6
VVSPAPQPQAGDGGDALSLDALTADISVFQRTKGHRFSSDDVVTAWAAMQVCPSPAHVLDLGCGLGSVLLHLAWSAPASTLVGIEAQDGSFALLERNVAHNGLGDRVRVHHGDLREPDMIEALCGPFDLVTGTPPYFPADTATDAMDAQRAFARIEHRGGIEAYVTTAATVLAADGWFVVCGDADASGRLERSAEASGLAVHRRWIVVPRAGRPPLFSVWALRHAAVAHGATIEHELVLRDGAGERTDDAKMIRAFSGFPERAPAQPPA